MRKKSKNEKEQMEDIQKGLTISLMYRESVIIAYNRFNKITVEQLTPIPSESLRFIVAKSITNLKYN